MKRPTRRQVDDRGVALVEAAIILPFLALLVFGMIEAGFAYRDSNILARAVQATARVDARVADGRTADYEALRTLESALSSIGQSSVERVIIFNASASGGSVPCKDLVPSPSSAVGQAGLCNVYSRQQLETDDPGRFTGACSGTWDASWCPTSRVRTGDSPQRVGVYVELSFDEVTKVLPGSLDINETAIYQLEPCIAGDPTC